MAEPDDIHADALDELLADDVNVHNTSVDSEDIPDSVKSAVREAEATLEDTTAEPFWDESTPQKQMASPGEPSLQPPASFEDSKPEETMSPAEPSLQPPNTRAPSPPTTHPVDYSPNRGSEAQGFATPSANDSVSSLGSRASRRSTASGKRIAELSSTSRLLQPTAARAGATRSRGGAGVDVDASRNLAKERVRERKKKEQQGKGGETSSQRKITMTPEEGLARARARVQIRKMKEVEAKDNENYVNNLPPDLDQYNHKKKSTRPLTVPQGPKLSTASRARAPAAKSDPSGAPSSPTASYKSSNTKRTLTRPKSPNFATAQRANVRNAASAMGARADDVDGRSVGSRSAADQSIGATTISTKRSLGSRRTLTVPQAPKFALDAKYGEKKRSPDKVSSFDDRSISSASTKNTRRSITVPQAPKFALDAKYGEKKTVTKTARDTSSLANEGDSFAHNLRSDNESVASSSTNWSQRKLTVPVAPKFHQSHSRARVKSTQEREMEELAKHKQFKAKPVPTVSDDTGSVNPVPARKLTVPVAPKFHETHQRAKPKSTAEREMEYMESHQLHKSKSRKGPSDAASVVSETSSRNGPRQLTVPVAPKFHTSTRRTNVRSTEDADNEEMKKQFKARQAPSFVKTTARASSARRSARQVSKENNIDTQFKARKMPDFKSNDKASTTTKTSTKAKSGRAPLSLTADVPPIEPTNLQDEPPFLETAARSEERRVQQEEAATEEESQQYEPHTEEGHFQRGTMEEEPPQDTTTMNEEAQPKNPKPRVAMTQSPRSTQTQPFHFHTSERTQARAEFRQSVKLKKQAVSPLTTSPSPRSPRVATQPKEFNFQTSSRSAARESFKQKVAQKKNQPATPPQEKRFHARSVPKSTYSSTHFISPHEKDSLRRAAIAGKRKVAASEGKDKDKDRPFKAKPVPSTTYKSVTYTSPLAKASMQSAANSGKRRLATSAEGKENGVHRFKARPVPKTTYSTPVKKKPSAPLQKQQPKKKPEPGNRTSTFRARPVPTSTYRAAVSPKGTTTSRARQTGESSNSASGLKSASRKPRLSVQTDFTAESGSPPFKARAVPKSTYEEGALSPRQTVASKSRMSKAATGKTTTTEEEPSPTFKARPSPKSDGRQSMLPRETRASKARLQLAKSKSSQEERESASFKARPAPKVRHSMSPRETVASMQRRKAMLEHRESATQKEDSTETSPPKFKARPAPKYRHSMSPRETVASMQRRKALQEQQAAAAAAEMQKTPEKPSPPAFKARPAPRMRASFPPPRETVASMRRRKATQLEAEESPSGQFRARPAPKVRASMSPRETVTSMSRRKANQQEEALSPSSFKARPVPSTTYTYSPISSFEKVFASSIVTDDDMIETEEGGREGEEHTIEFGDDHQDDAPLVFGLAQVDEHTIEFDEEGEEEEEINVSQILQSVNSPTN